MRKYIAAANEFFSIIFSNYISFYAIAIYSPYEALLSLLYSSLALSKTIVWLCVGSLISRRWHPSSRSTAQQYADVCEWTGRATIWNFNFAAAPSSTRPLSSFNYMRCKIELIWIGRFVLAILSPLSLSLTHSLPHASYFTSCFF